MPRTCTVCGHPERAAIDRALVADAPLRGIAGQYGLGKSAVLRHKAEHLPRLLRDARDAEEAATAAALLKDLRTLYRRAERILDKAERGRDLPLALRAISELRGLVSVSLKAVEVTELEERLSALEVSLSDRSKRRSA